MHPFCGKPVGQEGFGQHVVYPDCDSGKPQAISAPPILKAFALQGNKDAISSKDAANDVGSDESSEDDIISNSNVANVTELPMSTSSRASQQVTTIQNRRRVISWMEEYEKASGAKNIDVLVEESRATSSATPGFGIGAEFTIRRKKASEPQGFVWSMSSSEQMGALDLAIDPQAPKADENGAELSTKITSRWVQTVLENNRIVLREATGKRLVSPQKVEDIEKQVAYHLGKLMRGFESGLYDENAIENIDEIHFVVDFDDSETLGFGGEKQVKYADVVSGGNGMTWSCESAVGQDDVEGVCYRTGPKGWMDKRLFCEYGKAPRAQKPDRLGRKKTMFLDNCSSHLKEDKCAEELQKLNASLAFFQQTQWISASRRTHSLSQR
ncbi:hypothetical protein F441_10859 [Phytophthora nicotianae CJ01A1]|uniref:DDE-1 domain-containing protein n=1 Tax=Phytophthora nicotianae CJ01A1 TaxID=1317063 RepID=W2WV27_PHYNI|nr:hypothetical protein F441_10859 [Phytophthora nicotianae CJ01A1]